MDRTYDVIVVGGGMAGASVAFELAAEKRVLVLEAEEQPGYHATGRSAAAFIPSYGFDNPALRGLTLASRSALESPDAGFHAASFLRRRALLTLAHSNRQDALLSACREKSAALPSIEWVDSGYLRRALPLLKADYAQGAILEQDVFDIDVHALLESYLKGLKHRGGACESHSRVCAISRAAGEWRVETESGKYSAPVIVNAAGAWADEVAALAGAAPTNIQPRRRTAILVESPMDAGAWPLVMESGSGFYFKPDAGLLLVSPADETPSPPCDAAPEELDMAYAAHYLEQTMDIQVSRVQHAWAGLRSFAVDNTPVIGFDTATEGFFWLAGQGGHGIQIAPAAAQLAAALIAGQELPEALAAQGFDPAWVAPARLEKANRHLA